MSLLLKSFHSMSFTKASSTQWLAQRASCTRWHVYSTFFLHWHCRWRGNFLTWDIFNATTSFGFNDIFCATHMVLNMATMTIWSGWHMIHIHNYLAKLTFYCLDGLDIFCTLWYFSSLCHIFPFQIFSLYNSFPSPLPSCLCLILTFVLSLTLFCISTSFPQVNIFFSPLCFYLTSS